MKLKRTALPLLAVIIGVVALSGAAFANPIPDQIWSGDGSGSFAVGGTTYYVFHEWLMNFYDYNSTYWRVSGYWWDDDEHTGDIWGYVHKTTGAGSGYFDIDQTNPQKQGQWDGTFEYDEEEINDGEWWIEVASGDFWGTRDYP